jgi:hypothetical protein
MRYEIVRTKTGITTMDLDSIVAFTHNYDDKTMDIHMSNGTIFTTTIGAVVLDEVTGKIKTTGDE